jgi:hypothetical protein
VTVILCAHAVLFWRCFLREGGVGVSSSDAPGTIYKYGERRPAIYGEASCRQISSTTSVENIEHELLMIRRKKRCWWRNGIGDSINAQDLGESPNSTGPCLHQCHMSSRLDMLTSCRLRLFRMSWLGRKFEPFGSIEANQVILE